MKISHQKGSTRVNNVRDVMCLPAQVIIFATFQKCVTSIFIAILHSAYLSKIL